MRRIPRGYKRSKTAGRDSKRSADFISCFG
nr:MAG TPA: hypothetical protein [Caudoviricetes sp.]